MKTNTKKTDKSWDEIDALRSRLNQETIAKRQGKISHATNEDIFAAKCFGGRVAIFVDASGKPVF